MTRAGCAEKLARRESRQFPAASGAERRPRGFLTHTCVDEGDAQLGELPCRPSTCELSAWCEPYSLLARYKEMMCRGATVVRTLLLPCTS